ncbi:MAG: molecular chaperone HtpG [Deltaproteobacteria bacterium]|nr:molecular chaperone HtpG [Deltaproteobacteria bacterium]
MSKHRFETEVNQLLQLIIHSLYSHKEIFLRELISNASDALDKIKLLTLTDDTFKSYQLEPRIDISFDESAKTLTITDTGIGMSADDLIDQLGTIARSGTKSFMQKLTGDEKKDANLIGQFGVGFYSAFMVADRIEVTSRRAGTEHASRWVSDGKSDYEISEAERDRDGTTVVLHLNENGREYANRWSIQGIIKKYSNHIAFPIYLHYEDSRFEGEKEQRKEIKETKCEQVNAATALWKRSKKELSAEDYREFYKTIAHDSDDPMLFVHTQAEGTQEYTTLFYVPRKAPFDMYHANYRAGVKLYVRRVFITDDEKELMPSYLRFVRGIIDSEDLPLNVSREILQQNRILAKIKSGSVKKLLEEFAEMAKDREAYAAFITEYGRPLKEGLYQDYENREKLLELVRFKSTSAEGYTSLAEYKERMQADQKYIYYITGDNEQLLRTSPLLEMYRAKNIEVLIMDQDIDELVIPSVHAYKEVEFRSSNRTDAAEDLKTEQDKELEKQIEPLVQRIKTCLGDDVKNVKASTRLSDSPCCVVADENDPTVQMQTILKSLGQKNVPEFKPILEINPAHAIVKKMADIKDETLFEDISRLLLEQALLIEGVPIKDPASFARRLNDALSRALQAA